MKFVDVHSHLQFAAYGEDREAAFLRARSEDVGLITVGTKLSISQEAVAFARTHENVWATIGLHPIHTSKSYHDVAEIGGGDHKGFNSAGEVFDSAMYRALASDPKVVGIGECGLDYYRLTPETRKAQFAAFEAQIAFANEVGKPLMLHIRQAYKDAFDMVKRLAKVKGNVHFFAGSWEEATWFLDLGFTLSFTGVITFTKDYDEVVRNVPLDMFLTETDAPYVTPAPHRGERNEPLHVREVVKRIGEIKGRSIDEIEAAAVANAVRTFQLRTA